MEHHDLLIEIFTEELPPKRLSLLEKAFEDGIRTRLIEAELSFSTVRSFATPRRLALLVSKLADQQPTQKIERKGPNVKQAYDTEGKLTPAGKGFLNACGITIDQLSTIQTDKGECLHFVGEKPGLPVTTLIPEVIKATLKELPIPKPMRWGNHDFSFIRPVHSIIVLYGETVIPTEIFGLQSSHLTRGHRQLCHENIVIGFPDVYETEMEETGFVVVDAEKRKAIILDQINTLLQQKFSGKAQAKIDSDLLSEVVSLVEWPKVLLCQFDKAFLTVPQEALIASMQGHQKCFPVKDQNDTLLPYFLTVSNLDSEDKEAIIHGNERVMRARLSDAKFFYETDLKTKLDTYTPRLANTIYQEKLGTLQDKVDRITKLAVYFAKQLGADITLTKRAAELCKLDLFTHMVGEFPELQGIMGKYYALHEGETPEIANAIEEHYWPRFSDDKIPTAPISIALALADRLDTVISFFSIDLAPTGSKDPFALRRAASGFLKIVIENTLDLNLKEILKSDALIEFFKERFKTLALEKEMTVDVFNAIPLYALQQPYSAILRMQAVQKFKSNPVAPMIIQANKRVKNLLSKKSYGLATCAVTASLFEKEIEQKLLNQIGKADIYHLLDKHDYSNALLELAALAPIIDQFFAEVMIMTENLEVRENRLQLLHNLRFLFLRIADFAELQ